MSIVSLSDLPLSFNEALINVLNIEISLTVNDVDEVVLYICSAEGEYGSN